MYLSKNQTSGANPSLKYAVERPAQPVNAQDVR